ncbi:tetratricopeptide repeat protein [Calothrix sp. 336/3]|uniref:tetratricopeptide repeat protein n=1 Tax=Calothrix sp. 336/3 TaxID=1337936 RepID=UPI0004E2F902|nr:tetratricopeptide repeat protein [Calothrix sp. 336/3]AKG20373.1 hypothetical protein IJ00_02700 [Calothrix sp. 336/3]
MKSLQGLASVIILFGFTVCIPHAQAEMRLAQNQTPSKSQVIPQESINNNQDAKAKLKQAYDLFFESKNYRGAIAIFNEVIQLEPNNAYAYMGRGASYYELRNYQAAKTDLDKTIQLDTNISFAYFFRGLTNHALGGKNAAIADLQIAANMFEKEGSAKMAQRTLEIISQIRNA